MQSLHAACCPRNNQPGSSCFGAGPGYPVLHDLTPTFHPEPPDLCPRPSPPCCPHPPTTIVHPHLGAHTVWGWIGNSFGPPPFQAGLKPPPGVRIARMCCTRRKSADRRPLWIHSAGWWQGRQRVDGQVPPRTPVPFLTCNDEPVHVVQEVDVAEHGSGHVCSPAGQAPGGERGWRGART